MYLFIYNPKAGVSKRDELNEFIHCLNQSNIRFDLFLTDLNYGPIEIMNQVEHDYEGYIIAGGDGTVSQMVQGLYEHEVRKPLIILPIGTANEIAKNLGNVAHITDILSNLENLTERKVDLGVLNNTNCFTFALTFGNFTEVTYKTPQNLKNWLGYRAYLIYGFLTFRRIHAYGLKVRIDDESFSGSFVFGGITNSKSVGGIFHYDENAIELSDGLFEVMLIRKPRNVSQIRQILKGMMSCEYDNEMFVMRQCKEIEIESDTIISMNIDGEFAGDMNRFKATNHKEILTLMDYKGVIVND